MCAGCKDLVYRKEEGRKEGMEKGRERVMKGDRKGEGREGKGKWARHHFYYNPPSKKLTQSHKYITPFLRVEP